MASLALWTDSDLKFQTIDYFSAGKKVVLSCFSCVLLFATLWTVALQVPLTMGSSRQEYWSALPCPPPGDLFNLRIEPVSLTSPALADGFFTTGTPWEASQKDEVHLYVLIRREIQNTFIFKNAYYWNDTYNDYDNSVFVLKSPMRMYVREMCIDFKIVYLLVQEKKSGKIKLLINYSKCILLRSSFLMGKNGYSSFTLFIPLHQ